MGLTKVIAEIGNNASGDFELNKKFIKAAKESGAHWAKFQTFSVDRLMPGEWDHDGRTEIYKRAELSKQKHLELKVCCDIHGIEFMSSAFSIPDAKLLKSISDKYIKIPSFEIRNLELLQYVKDNFNEIYISTGTSKFDEVQVVKELMVNSNATFLHCISSYPCDPQYANLGRLNLFKIFGIPKVGYSDHCSGIDVAKISLDYDLDVIEKHFTIDKNLPFRDNKFSILPDEMKDLTDYIKLRDLATKYISPDYLPIEQNQRDHYAGRFNKQ